MAMRGKLWALVALAGTMAVPALGAPLVEDRFNDGDRFNGADPLDVGWSISSGSNLVISAFNTSGNTSNSLRAQNANTFAMVSGNYTAPTLTDGQTITLSLDFRLTNIQNGTMRFALGNTIENISFNFGTGTSLGGSLVRYPADLISGSTIDTHTLSGTTFAINDTLPHSLTLALTRSGSTLLMAGNVDGAHPFTGLRSNVTNFAFGRIRIGQGNTTMYYNIDNVVVAIPEPASMASLCLPAAGMLLRRKRG